MSYSLSGNSGPFCYPSSAPLFRIPVASRVVGRRCREMSMGVPSLSPACTSLLHFVCRESVVSKSWLHPFSVVWLKASYLTPLSHSFLNSKMGVTVPTLECCCEDKLDNVCESAWNPSGTLEASVALQVIG